MVLGGRLPKVGDGLFGAIIYFVSKMVVLMRLSDRTLSIRRSGWPGIRCAFPLLSVLVLVSRCAGGGGAGCGVALPWVHVINQDGPTISVRLYDGASPVIVPAGMERVIHPSFGASSLPPPPWHLTVHETATGRVMIERQLVAKDAIREVTIRRDSVSVRPTSLPSTGGRC
jgi:hypothetical protein